MTEKYAPVSETGLGYDVFAPLWAILELGAVVASGARSLRDVSLADFMAGRREEVARLLEVVRRVGDFSPETTAIFEEQGGWSNGRHEVTAEALLMYSGCIEGYPADTEEPAVLRRLVRMGADLQLVTLMDALVGAAVGRGAGPKTAPGLIVTAVRIAGELVGVDGSRVVVETFRMWRFRCLPEVLRPDAPSREGVKESLRWYAHELELLVASDEAGREVTPVSEELLARDVFGPLGGGRRRRGERHGQLAACRGFGRGLSGVQAGGRGAAAGRYPVALRVR